MEAVFRKICFGYGSNFIRKITFTYYKIDIQTYTFISLKQVTIISSKQVTMYILSLGKLKGKQISLDTFIDNSFVHEQKYA